MKKITLMPLIALGIFLLITSTVVLAAITAPYKTNAPGACPTGDTLAVNGSCVAQESGG